MGTKKALVSLVLFLISSTTTDRACSTEFDEHGSANASTAVPHSSQNSPIATPSMSSNHAFPDW